MFFAVRYEREAWDLFGIYFEGHPDLYVLRNAAPSSVSILILLVLVVASLQITVLTESQSNLGRPLISSPGFEGHPLRKDFPLTVRLKFWVILKTTCLMDSSLGLHGGQVRRGAQTCRLRASPTHPSLPVRLSLTVCRSCETELIFVETSNRYHHGSRSGMVPRERDLQSSSTFPHLPLSQRLARNRVCRCRCIHF